MIERMKNYSIACHTLGCKVNRYETDAVRGRFLAAGFQEVPFDQAADVYLVNTCTVTGEADRKTRQVLRRARKMNPQAIIAAMGCHVETYGAQGLADVCVGSGARMELVSRIENALETRANGLAVTASTICRPLPDQFEEIGPVIAQSESRAYIKIQDGCDAFCSYCAIPYARGRSRSRDSAAILQEAKALIAAGFEEIVLTGIHLSAYAIDKGKDTSALGVLIRELAQLDGLRRLRLGSLEPESLSPSFIEMISGISVLCPHFHLSLQSGSATVLQRMNRAYDPLRFSRVVSGLRAAFPGAGITTDVMAGFPGESAAEHADSVAFCRQMAFTRMHIFRYSRRDGTKAADMPGQVPAPVAAERARELTVLAEQMAVAFSRRLHGSTREILVESVDEKGHGEGYTPEYAHVRLVDMRPGWEGRIISCRLQATDSSILLGTPVLPVDADPSY